MEVADEDRLTPLNFAASRDHVEIIKMMIKKGTNIETLDRNEEMPLYSTTKWGHIEIIKILIEKGANIETNPAN